MRKNPQDAFYRSFDHLFLYITTRCDFGCAYCYLGGNGGDDMPPRMVRQAARFFGQLGARFVTILGGEPTRHAEFTEAVRLFHTCGFKVIVDTNGAFSENLLSQLEPSMLSWLLFSLDSSTDSGYSLRGAGDWAQIVRTVAQAAEMGFTVGIITTLSRLNAHEAELMPPFAASVGAQLVNFHRMMPQGRGRGLTKLMVPPLEWIDLCARLEDAARHLSVDVLYPPVFVRAHAAERFARLGYRGCTARSADRVSLFPDGTIKLCSLFLDSDRSFGRFVDGRISLEQGLGSELAYEFSMSETCRACQWGEAEGFCGGGCRRYFEIVDELGLRERCCEEYVIICPLWKVRLAPSQS